LLGGQILPIFATIGRPGFILAALDRLADTVAMHPATQEAAQIIDDLSSNAPMASIGTSWQLFTDQVMGGVSIGAMTREIVAGRLAIRMRGDVSLENNGGFIQMALDLAPEAGAADASAWSGIELDFYGNDADYGAHLRTSDLARPWQSYRQTFRAAPEWQTTRLPFSGFGPHRTEIPLDLRRLRRMGLAAIGRAFSADLAVGGLRFFR
jgi:hypothetical protein